MYIKVLNITSIYFGGLFLHSGSDWKCPVWNVHDHVMSQALIACKQEVNANTWSACWHSETKEEKIRYTRNVLSRCSTCTCIVLWPTVKMIVYTCVSIDIVYVLLLQCSMKKIHNFTNVINVFSLFHFVNKLAVIPLPPCCFSRLIFLRTCVDLHFLESFINIHKKIFLCKNVKWVFLIEWP